MSPETPEHSVQKNKELASAISLKEQEMLDMQDLKGEGPTIPEEADLVDEEEVQKKVDAIEKRIASSPLPENLKDPIKKKMDEVSEKWKGEVEIIDASHFGALENVAEQIKADLDEFEQKPEVKEIFETFEPFFKNKDKILPVINLETYGRSSGDWEKINYRLLSSGIDKPLISAIQEKLNIEVDGEVGPETINALGEMYGTPIDVKFADSTKYKEGTQEDFDKKYTDAQQEVLKKVVDKGREIYKGVKTYVDVKKAEREERQTLAKAEELLEMEKRAAKKDHDERYEKWAEQDAEKTFATVNEHLNLSKDAQKIYFINYVDVQHPRFAISEINEKIKDLASLADKYLPGEKESILREAFGQLVNGVDPGLAQEKLSSAMMLKKEEMDSSYKNRMGELGTNFQKLSDQRKGFMGFATNMTATNTDMMDYIYVWGGMDKSDKSEGIDDLVELIGGLDKSIKAIEEQADEEVKSRMNALNEFYDDSVTITKVTNTELSEDFLKKAEKDYNAIGSEVPEYGDRDEIYKALKKVKDQEKVDKFYDPNLSEIDKLLLMGKIDEAVKLLKSIKDEREDAEKDSQLFKEATDEELLNLYRSEKGKELSFGEKMGIETGRTFAQQKMKEGYTRVELKKGQVNDIMRNKTIDVPNRYSVLVKEDEEGNIHYVYCQQMTGEAVDEEGYRGEYIIKKERVKELDERKEADHESVQKIMAEMPAIGKMERAAGIINQKFAPLQAIFQAGEKGAKTEAYVNMAKGYAKDIQENGEIRMLGSYAEQSLKDLYKLKGLITGEHSEFEAKLDKQIKNLEYFAKHFTERKIDNFCNKIRSGSYTDDAFGKWFLKEGAGFSSAIVLATTAIIVIGTAPVSLTALAVSAMVGTAAGMIGNELGVLAGERIGKAIYDDENFENKTTLGKYVDQELFDGRVLDENGKEVKIKGSAVFVEYATNFVVGSAITFATLGLATRFVGPQLVRFVNANQGNMDKIGKVARLIAKFPQMQAKTVGLQNEKGISTLIKKIAHESVEELGEEGTQEIANNIDGRLGFIIGVLSSTNANHANYELGGFDLVQNSSSIEGSDVSSEWSFRADQATEFEAQLKKKYGEGMKFKIETNQETGEITATRTEKGKTKKGKPMEYTNKMVFKPTTSSIELKRFLSRDGNQEYGALFGISEVGNLEYTYKTAQPEGKLPLAKMLKREGFGVKVDSDGTITAIKGNDKLTFKQSDKSPTPGPTSPPALPSEQKGTPDKAKKAETKAKNSKNNKAAPRGKKAKKRAKKRIKAEKKAALKPTTKVVGANVDAEPAPPVNIEGGGEGDKPGRMLKKIVLEKVNATDKAAADLTQTDKVTDTELDSDTKLQPTPVVEPAPAPEPIAEKAADTDTDKLQEEYADRKDAIVVMRDANIVIKTETPNVPKSRTVAEKQIPKREASIDRKKGEFKKAKGEKAQKLEHDILAEREELIAAKQEQLAIMEERVGILTPALEAQTEKLQKVEESISKLEEVKQKREQMKDMDEWERDNFIKIKQKLEKERDRLRNEINKNEEELGNHDRNIPKVKGEIEGHKAEQEAALASVDTEIDSDTVAEQSPKAATLTELDGMRVEHQRIASELGEIKGDMAKLLKKKATKGNKKKMAALEQRFKEISHELEKSDRLIKEGGKARIEQLKPKLEKLERQVSEAAAALRVAKAKKGTPAATFGPKYEKVQEEFRRKQESLTEVRKEIGKIEEEMRGAEKDGARHSAPETETMTEDEAIKAERAELDRADAEAKKAKEEFNAQAKKEAGQLDPEIKKSEFYSQIQVLKDQVKKGKLQPHQIAEKAAELGGESVKIGVVSGSSDILDMGLLVKDPNHDNVWYSLIPAQFIDNPDVTLSPDAVELINSTVIHVAKGKEFKSGAGEETVIITNPDSLASASGDSKFLDHSISEFGIHPGEFIESVETKSEPAPISELAPVTETVTETVTEPVTEPAPETVQTHESITDSTSSLGTEIIAGTKEFLGKMGKETAKVVESTRNGIAAVLKVGGVAYDATIGKGVDLVRKKHAEYNTPEAKAARAEKKAANKAKKEARQKIAKEKEDAELEAKQIAETEALAEQKVILDKEKIGLTKMDGEITNLGTEIKRLQEEWSGALEVDDGSEVDVNKVRELRDQIIAKNKQQREMIKKRIAAIDQAETQYQENLKAIPRMERELVDEKLQLDTEKAKNKFSYDATSKEGPEGGTMYSLREGSVRRGWASGTEAKQEKYDLKRIDKRKKDQAVLDHTTTRQAEIDAKEEYEKILADQGSWVEKGLTPEQRKVLDLVNKGEVARIEVGKGGALKPTTHAIVDSQSISREVRNEIQSNKITALKEGESFTHPKSGREYTRQGDNIYYKGKDSNFWRDAGNKGTRLVREGGTFLAVEKGTMASGKASKDVALRVDSDGTEQYYSRQTGKKLTVNGDLVTDGDSIYQKKTPEGLVNTNTEGTTIEEDFPALQAQFEGEGVQLESSQDGTYEIRNPENGEVLLTGLYLGFEGGELFVRKNRFGVKIAGRVDVSIEEAINLAKATKAKLDAKSKVDEAAQAQEATAVTELQTKKFLEQAKTDPKQSQGTRDILNSKAEVFKYSETINIDGQTFYLGETLVDPNDGNRLYVVALNSNNGVLRPRLFYKSQSQGRWRSTNGFRPDGGLGKGKESNPIHSYGQETMVNGDIEEVLERKESEAKILPADTLINGELDETLMPLLHVLNVAREYEAEIQYYHALDGRISKLQHELREFGVENKRGNNKTFKNKSEAEINDILAEIEYPEGFIPDFSKGPIRPAHKSTHPVLGEVTNEVYRGKVDGKDVDWTMTHDGQGKAWISSIRFTDAKTNSYGSDLPALSLGILTQKPVEYNSQLPFSMQDTELNGDDYIDITQTLEHIAPIKQYKAEIAKRSAQKMKSIEGVNEGILEKGKPYGYKLNNNGEMFVNLGADVQLNLRVAGDTLYIMNNGNIEGEIVKGSGSEEIGRGKFGINNGKVSRAHANIEFTNDGEIRITDLGSANGTHIVEVKNSTEQEVVAEAKAPIEEASENSKAIDEAVPKIETGEIEKGGEREYEMGERDEVSINLGPETQVKIKREGDMLKVFHNGKEVGSTKKGGKSLMVGRTILGDGDLWVSNEHMSVELSEAGTLKIIDNSRHGTDIVSASRFLEAGKAYSYDIDNNGELYADIGEKSFLKIKRIGDSLQIKVNGEIVETVKKGESMILGKNSDGLSDHNISEKHIKIEYDTDGKIKLTDLDSEFGTGITSIIDGMHARPERNPDGLPFKEVTRAQDVVPVPDLHGDPVALDSTLRAHGLIDGEGKWIGGDTRVQLTGDLFDKGPDSIKVLEKIIKYREEGANIDFVVGNHDVFTLGAILGDLPSARIWDVNNQNPAEMKSFKEAFKKNPKLFDLFKDSKVMEQVDDVLYMHGEMSDQALRILTGAPGGIDAINKNWQASITQAIETGDTSLFRAAEETYTHIFWSRAMSSGGKDKLRGSEMTDRGEAGRVLKAMGINLVVHGHTANNTHTIDHLGDDVTTLNLDSYLSSGYSAEGEGPKAGGGAKITKDGQLQVNDSSTNEKVDITMDNE